MDSLYRNTLLHSCKNKQTNKKQKQTKKTHTHTQQKLDIKYIHY